MDEIDEAQHREEFFRELALKKGRSRGNEKPLIVAGRRLCLDCEEPIPEGRLRANPDAVRCIGCQARHERRQGPECPNTGNSFSR